MRKFLVLGAVGALAFSATAQDYFGIPAVGKNAPRVLPGDPSGDWLFGTGPVFDTGIPTPVLFNGNPVWLFWTSGNVNDNWPQRYTGQPFTLTESTLITGINHDMLWFPDDFADAGDTIGIRIWSRNGEDRPVEGDELFIGTVPAPVKIENPRMGVFETLSRIRDLEIGPLAAGDYSLSVYGLDSGGEFRNGAWLTNGADGIPKINENGPWMWRSAMYPEPGFEVYQLSRDVLREIDGEDPDHVYNASFALFGDPAEECDVCDMDCDGDVDAFDIEPFLALLFDENLPPCCGTRGTPPFTGDTDGDGDIDAFDIEPFLGCLFP